MQNFGRFWTTSDFDHEYLRNGPTYPKSENVTNYSNSSCVWWKKSGELWSTNGLEFHVSLDPLKCTFLAEYISAHRGCCALKILHALEIDQALIAHTQSGTGVPPNKIQSWKFKIWLKIQRISHYNFGVSGSIPTKHFPYNVPPGRGYNVGITFGRPAP